MKYTFLDINLLFDPAKVWQHTSQFEKAFFDFLETKGLQGEVVNTVGGSAGKLFYLIRAKEMIPMPTPPPSSNSKSPQQKLKEMAQKPQKKK